VKIVDLQWTLTNGLWGKGNELKYEGWNFNSGNYLFTNDTK